MPVASFNVKTLHKAFRGLYSDIQRSFAECGSKQFEPTTVKTVDAWMQLPLPADMRRRLVSNQPNGSGDDEFFPAEIQRHILNEHSISIAYKFSVGGRAVSLHFVVFNKRIDKLNMNEMAAKARRVCALLHLVSLHASRAACSSTLNIFIYMTEFKKRFPTRKGEAFESEHANTGLSYHCARNNDVVVYRQEEWFKVLIHELFHAFGLSFIEGDLPDGADAAMQRVLQRTYAIAHPVRIYETYCEIWARILNVMFTCFSEDTKCADTECADTKCADTECADTECADTKCADTEVDLAVFGDCVMQGLRKDADHALHQCAKIMHHTGIPSRVLLNPTDENRAIVAEKYRENTNVFAYYVLTCALQHSHELFLEWCYKNNPFIDKKPRANVMQFRTNRSNFNSFMELLRHCKARCPDVPQLNMNPSGSSMRMTLPSPTE